MQQKRLLVVLSMIIGIVFIWSVINPRDYGVWLLEVAPVLIALPVLILTYKRFPLTNLAYCLIAVHMSILLIGGHYTYEFNPLFTRLKEMFDWKRNYYDRVGHFFQGFVPVVIAREFFLRVSPLQRGKILTFVLLSFVMLVSSGYELVEWASVYTVPPEQVGYFLGMQGDIFDAQKDMLMALIGAIAGLLLFSRMQDRQLEAMKRRNFRV